MSLNLEKSRWRRVALGEVAKSSKEKVDPIGGSIERYVAGEHMDTGSLRIRRWGSVNETNLGPAFHRRFHAGQVLYGSRRTYLRKVAVADFNGVCANTTFVVGAKDENILLQRFLPFIMMSEPFHSFAINESKGSVNPYVNWSDIERFKFYLPPLGQQKRIADLLWAVENHRRFVESVSLRKVERFLLEALLKIDSPKVPVSSMGSVLMGRQRSPQNAEGDHLTPYLRVANVGDNRLRLGDIKFMNFTPGEQRRYNIEKTDILISEGQSRELVGQSVLVGELPQSMCFQNTLIRFRANREKVLPAYAQVLFRACLQTGIFSDIAVQTTSIAHLGVQRFSALQLPIPSVEEQELLLIKIDTLDNALEGVAAEIANLTALRAALLTEIFGGD